jgi:hypothetical protein
VIGLASFPFWRIGGGLLSSMSALLQAWQSVSAFVPEMVSGNGINTASQRVGYVLQSGSGGEYAQGFSPRSLKGVGESGGAYKLFRNSQQSESERRDYSKFDLINVYDVADSSKERAVEALEDNVNFEQQDDESITIEVLDKDPQRQRTLRTILSGFSMKLASNWEPRRLGATENILNGNSISTSKPFVPQRIH